METTGKSGRLKLQFPQPRGVRVISRTVKLRAPSPLGEALRHGPLYVFLWEIGPVKHFNGVSAQKVKKSRQLVCSV